MKKFFTWFGAVFLLIVGFGSLSSHPTPTPSTNSITSTPTATINEVIQQDVTPSVTSIPLSTPAPMLRATTTPTHYSSVPVGATAQCKDGTYSYSVHRSGTCSHHGGVAIWL